MHEFPQSSSANSQTCNHVLKVSSFNELSRVWVVYKVTSPSGKTYVGITGRTLDRRQIEHAYQARSGSHRHFANALRKYGEAMVWELLDEGIESLEEANDLECAYVTQLRSSDRQFGYNLTEGGDGVVATAETRTKMSVSAKRRGVSAKQLSNLDKGRGGFWRGRKHSAATKQKLSDIHTGRVISNQTRKKMSEAHRGRIFTGDHKQRLREVNAHPLLRSDGVVFLSGGEASRSVGFKSSDAVLKAIRKGRLTGPYAFERISLERFWELEAEGCRWDGTVTEIPKGTSSRSLSAEHRANIGASQKPQSKTHRENRLKAISKPVFRSDGKRFDSMLEAASEIGVSRDRIFYAIKRGRVLNGFVYSHDPVASEQVSRALELHSQKKTIARQIQRSDGETYPSMTAAAKAVGRKLSTLSQAIKMGRPVKGFMFTKVKTELALSSRGETYCG